MSLSAFNIVVNASWEFSKLNVPFTPTGQGPDSVNFNLNNLDLTIFNEAYIASLTVPPGTADIIDLTDLVDLLGDAFAFHRVLGLLVLPGSDGSCTFGPYTASSPFLGPFSSADDYQVIGPDGIYLNVCSAVGDDETAGPGNWHVYSGHHNLLVGNVGAGDLAVTVIIGGSTTG